jgi:hypothetical protein
MLGRLLFTVAFPECDQEAGNRIELGIVELELGNAAVGMLLESDLESNHQSPVSSAFLSEPISHQQSVSRTFLSEQISTSHQPNEQAARVRLNRITPRRRWPPGIGHSDPWPSHLKHTTQPSHLASS